MLALHRMISRFSLVRTLAALAIMAGAFATVGTEAGTSWTMMPGMLDLRPARGAAPAAPLARTVADHTLHPRDPLPDAESPPGRRGTPLHEARDSHQCECPRNPRRHP